jgi:hypothetical protein
MTTDIQDDVLDAAMADKIGRKITRTKPLSLRPGPMITEAAAEGHPVARAIAEAWRFRFPVTVLPADVFDSLVAGQADTVFVSEEEEETEEEAGANEK